MRREVDQLLPEEAEDAEEVEDVAMLGDVHRVILRHRHKAVPTNVMWQAVLLHVQVQGTAIQRGL